jgi:hypothetical protein
LILVNLTSSRGLIYYQSFAVLFQRRFAMTKSFTAAYLALGLSVAALSPSIAQTTDQNMPMMGMMGGGCQMMGMMGMRGHGMMGRQAKMGAMVDGRLAYLKSELNITDAQAEAWTGYAQAVKGRLDAMQSKRQSMMDAMQKGSAIERMNARIAGMEVMLDALKAINPAIEKLYAVLTDEQKKQADELIGMDCGAM